MLTSELKREAGDRWQKINRDRRAGLTRMKPPLKKKKKKSSERHLVAAEMKHTQSNKKNIQINLLVNKYGSG